jgi:hypothetical protein
MKLRDMWAADFETTTHIDDCRVWLWCLINLEDTEEKYFGLDINSFVNKCEELTSSIIYFHNLAFDGSFILDYLLSNNFKHRLDVGDLRFKQFTTLISKTNKFYSITVKWPTGAKTQFRDSLKKLPMSVSEISKSFHLTEIKGSIDYDMIRPIGYSPTVNELEYVETDTLIVAKALRAELEQGMTRLTIGSDSLMQYRKMSGRKMFEKTFPVLPTSVDSEIRKAYRGGYTYADDRFKGRITGPGMSFDVNSLYPYVMKECSLPYGEPIFADKPKDGYLWIAAITLTARLKPNHIPCIQIKGSSYFIQTEYIKEIKEPTLVYCTNVDYQLWEKHYEITVFSWEGCWLFNHCVGMFTEYVDHWSEIKQNSEGGLRAIAKLHLNSLYGKFATNPDITSRIPVMENGVVKLVKGSPETRNPVYTPVGCFVTAYARELTITSAQQNYAVFAYADTDSLHLITDKLPANLKIDPNILGWWKHELTFKRAFYARAKAYAEELYDGTTEVHIAGMPREISKRITIEDFVSGKKWDGKLVPKRVKGGIVLENTTFTLQFIQPSTKG